MNEYAKSLVFAFAVALVAPYLAVAQTNSETQTPQELRRQLDELRVQMADQMKLMDALQTRLDEMERATHNAGDSRDGRATAGRTAERA